LFAANNLVLNFNAKNIIKLKTRNSSHSTLHIGDKEKYIEDSVNTNFLGLQLDNHINWKNHIEEMIPNLSTFYANRLMVHISNINTLKSIYYTYLHSIIKYGIIVWGNSFKSGKIFSLEKKIVRNIAGAKSRSSCKILFEQLEILPVPCQYILSLLNLIINNQKIFQKIHLYTTLIQGKSIFFRDQMPTYFVFK
jgi:hypothetical protein